MTYVGSSVNGVFLVSLSVSLVVLTLLFVLCVNKKDGASGIVLNVELKESYRVNSDVNQQNDNDDMETDKAKKDSETAGEEDKERVRTVSILDESERKVPSIIASWRSKEDEDMEVV